MKLTVIMFDTWRTQMAIEFENESRPYGRRTVQIELTPDQAEQIKPLAVGTTWSKEKGCTVDVTEVIGQCWLEETT